MSSALTGDVIYSDGCSTENKAFLEQTVLYGRIVAASAAYDECISQAVTGTVQKYEHDLTTRRPVGHFGPYQACIGDPYRTELPERQITRPRKRWRR